MKETTQDPLATLQDIRSMMERSSRFLSLSGLAGVTAGIAALAGVALAYYRLGVSPLAKGYYEPALMPDGRVNWQVAGSLLALFTAVLAVALLGAAWFSRRKARLRGLPFWDSTARRLVARIGVPLAAGGLLALIFMAKGMVTLVAPATLLFYGLALTQAGHYTLPEMRYLGLFQVALGLLGAAFPDYGLLLWAIGFGILHILYGLFMYSKYER